jgi:hypothetical protein
LSIDTQFVSQFEKRDLTASLLATWQVERLYLVEIREPDERADFSLNLDSVFVLDRVSRELKRGEVIWNESIDAGTDLTTLTLRIR